MCLMDSYSTLWLGRFGDTTIGCLFIWIVTEQAVNLVRKERREEEVREPQRGWLNE